jgi:hypothetical protein
MRALRCRDKGKPAARRGRKTLGPAPREGRQPDCRNGEEKRSLSGASHRAPRPGPHERKGKVVYALMKMALGRRDSVGSGLPLAALVAFVAAMAALLLLTYGASPAHAAGSCSTTSGTTTCTFGRRFPEAVQRRRQRAPRGVPLRGARRSEHHPRRGPRRPRIFRRRGPRRSRSL